MDLIVGTFNTPHLYTLRFTPPTSHSSSSSLRVLTRTSAIGSHSWLALNKRKTHLYATAWTEPPSVAAYALSRNDEGVTVPSLINNASTASRSGYVCVSDSHLYTAGGSSGEVFTLRPDGGIGDCAQKLSFVDAETSIAKGGEVPHGDFGGLRHGAHSVDLSPDERSLYIADIGRNCIWTYSVAAESEVSPLSLGSKHISLRTNGGPRHTTPHPNGRVLYSLQEHSCMIDQFAIAEDGVSLTHVKGVRIIPDARDEKSYWADEVRVGASADGKPKYIYASTRGLEKETMGYVAVFRLTENGTIRGEALHIWETPTSGGWANAVEPTPTLAVDGTQWLALTDSDEGFVFILSFDGSSIEEVARCKLPAGESGEVAGAATAVWL